jgi:hypothetical protein
MTVGIDSQILIYAQVVPSKPGKKIPEHAKEHLKDLRRRSKLLLSLLQDEIIVLPMVAVAELLVPVPASRRGLLLKDFPSDSTVVRSMRKRPHTQPSYGPTTKKSRQTCDMTIAM